jgi:hypothetical protein
MLESLVIEVLVDLVPVTQSQRNGTPLGCLAARVLQEATGISHEKPP